MPGAGPGKIRTGVELRALAALPPTRPPPPPQDELAAGAHQTRRQGAHSLPFNLVNEGATHYYALLLLASEY